jgi:hypothetical protein
MKIIDLINEQKPRLRPDGKGGFVDAISGKPVTSNAPAPTWADKTSQQIKNVGKVGSTLAQQTGKVGTAAVRGFGKALGATTAGVGGALGSFARGVKAGWKGEPLSAALPKKDSETQQVPAGQQAQQPAAQDIAGIDQELAGLKSMINRLNQRIDAMAGNDPKLKAFPAGGKQATG